MAKVQKPDCPMGFDPETHKPESMVKIIDIQVKRVRKVEAAKPTATITDVNGHVRSAKLVSESEGTLEFKERALTKGDVKGKVYPITDPKRLRKALYG